MEKKWVQHIGDAQLVDGMPKHMVGTSTHGSLAKFREIENETSQQTESSPEGDHYWTVHPKPKACEKCLALEGEQFTEEPLRPHPNCRCEIKKHSLRKQKKHINGSLSIHEWHLFKGGRHVQIKLRGVWGGLTTGVWIEVNGKSEKNVACPPGTSHTIDLTTDETVPVLWKIRLIAHGSDNVQVDYEIVYENWDD